MWVARCEGVRNLSTELLKVTNIWIARAWGEREHGNVYDYDLALGRTTAPS